MGGVCCGNGLKKSLLQRYPKTISFLRMQPKLGVFISFFKKYDYNQSGTLSLVEFLDSCDLERNRFTIRVFSGGDTDTSGEIDFRELLFTVWNVCTLDRDGLAVYTFKLYDVEDAGYIGKAKSPLT
eukprot:gb/GECG01008454.1/.p1 GENE.gb/GECG01008454.1/~~gb/GECG01008454.1/.p1  ORF type:complete len:126 (+),score=6.43 gb/GECG01008454.1/:1-378(+)